MMERWERPQSSHRIGTVAKGYTDLDRFQDENLTVDGPLKGIAVFLDLQA